MRKILTGVLLATTMAAPVAAAIPDSGEADFQNRQHGARTESRDQNGDRQNMRQESKKQRGDRQERRQAPQAQVQAQPSATARTGDSQTMTRTDARVRTGLDRQDRREGYRDGREIRRDTRVEQRHDRRDRRVEQRRDRRAWNRDWRNDRQYDWQHWRSLNRSVFSLGRYYAPYRGHHYNRLSIGFRLGPLFFSSRYWINDPWRYRLPPAYPGTRWIRYYNDALLIDKYSGEVIDVIYDFFW